MKRDTSLFASKAEQVSCLNVQIKDGLTEIQNDTEEIQAAVKSMQTGGRKKSNLGGNGVVQSSVEH